MSREGPILYGPDPRKVTIDWNRTYGNTGVIHPLQRPSQYVTWWKKDKAGDMVELHHLGIFSSPDEIQGRCEAESKKSAEFVRRFVGGMFYPVDIMNTYRIDPGMLAWYGIVEGR